MSQVARRPAGIPPLGNSNLLEQVSAQASPVVPAPQQLKNQEELKARQLNYDRPVPLGWKMLVRLQIENPAAPASDLAKGLGFTKWTLYAWQKNPEFQRYEDFVLRNTDLAGLTRPEVEERASAMEKVRNTFETHAEEMQRRLLAIADQVDDPDLVAKISMDWLDRAGAPAQRANQQRGVSVNISDEIIQKLFDRAVEAGLPQLAKAEVVDVEVVPATRS